MEISREQEQFHPGQGFAKTLSGTDKYENSLIDQIKTVFQVKMQQIGHIFEIFLRHPRIFQA
jgi:hypothetical protein